MYVAVLGILKSGAAYVPMHAELFPSERIKFIVEDTDMKLLVTSREHVRLVNDLSLESVDDVLIVEDTVGIVCSQTKPRQPISSVKPTDCAYMIYTPSSIIKTLHRNMWA